MATGERTIPKAIEHTNFPARALYIGETIDLRSFVQTSRVYAQQPATIAIDGGGVAVVHRYGAVVFFDVTSDAEQRFLGGLMPLVSQVYERPESEDVRIT